MASLGGVWLVFWAKTAANAPLWRPDLPVQHCLAKVGAQVAGVASLGQCFVLRKEQKHLFGALTCLLSTV